MQLHGNFFGAALICLIKANFIELFNIWKSSGLYILAEDENSIPHIMHVHTISSGFEINLHFLLEHIK